MHWIDWLIVVGYLGAITLVGLLFIKRANSSVAEYFVAGRSLPWWLAGTSLVATSFAADTPLFVAGLIATKGIAGNWVWWNQVVAWALAIAFFARLWRRSGVVTDAEFVELRYSGPSAAFLRGFRGFYVSCIFSTATLAWVMLAMQKIVAATIAQPEWVAAFQTSLESSLGVSTGSIDLWKVLVLGSLFVLATLYTALSGMWGIVVTDLLQLAVAMVGSCLFAWYALDSVGGMAELQSRLAETLGDSRSTELLSLFPGPQAEWMPWGAFLVFLTIVWWGDCNGFAAQRLFSTRSENDSVLAAIWYAILHFAIRPWPWVIVGLVALVLYPGLEDPETGYPRLLNELLPTGLRGLLIASLLAAFMSTVDTHLNWNASYFVNDIYRRFMNPGATDRQCVLVSKLAVLAFAALSIVVALFMTSIQDAVLLLFNLQAGIGLVLMLRWFWWRVNAWSEVAAMVGSLIVTTTLPWISESYALDWSVATRIVITVLVVTPFWVAVTYLTAPTSQERLDAFYRRIRPPAALWGPVASRHPDIASDLSAGRTLTTWGLVMAALFSLMLCVGSLVLLRIAEAAGWAAVTTLSSFWVWKSGSLKPAVPLTNTPN